MFHIVCALTLYCCAPAQYEHLGNGIYRKVEPCPDSIALAQQMTVCWSRNGEITTQTTDKNDRPAFIMKRGIPRRIYDKGGKKYWIEVYRPVDRPGWEVCWRVRLIQDM